jgi:hypothetical protein
MVRITESSGLIDSNSPALLKLGRIALEAFYHSGRFFLPESDGLTEQLAPMLLRHGFERIQSHAHTLVLRAGTSEGQHFYEDMKIGYRVGLPFLQHWIHVPGDYEELYQQALKEMQATDFVATWRLLTVCGIKPERSRPLLMRGLK